MRQHIPSARVAMRDWFVAETPAPRRERRPSMLSPLAPRIASELTETARADLRRAAADAQFLAALLGALSDSLDRAALRGEVDLIQARAVRAGLDEAINRFGLPGRHDAPLAGVWLGGARASVARLCVDLGEVPVVPAAPLAPRQRPARATCAEGLGLILTGLAQVGAGLASGMAGLWRRRGGRAGALAVGTLLGSVLFALAILGGGI